MSNITTFLHKRVMEHVFLGKRYDPPTEFYLALFTDTIPKDGAGKEVLGSNYKRQIIKLRAAEIPGIAYNTNIIMFPKAISDWGNIVEVGIMDAAEGGSMLMHTRIDKVKSKRIEKDDVLSWDINAFRIRY